jgi:hypothetical protein
MYRDSERQFPVDQRIGVVCMPRQMVIAEGNA